MHAPPHAVGDIRNPAWSGSTQVTITERRRRRATVCSATVYRVPNLPCPRTAGRMRERSQGSTSRSSSVLSSPVSNGVYLPYLIYSNAGRARGYGLRLTLRLHRRLALPSLLWQDQHERQAPEQLLRALRGDDRHGLPRREQMRTMMPSVSVSESISWEQPSAAQQYFSKLASLRKAQYSSGDTAHSWTAVRGAISACPVHDPPATAEALPSRCAERVSFHSRYSISPLMKSHLSLDFWERRLPTWTQPTPSRCPAAPDRTAPAQATHASDASHCPTQAQPTTRPTATHPASAAHPRPLLAGCSSTRP